MINNNHYPTVCQGAYVVCYLFALSNLKNVQMIFSYEPISLRFQHSTLKI